MKKIIFTLLVSTLFLIQHSSAQQIDTTWLRQYDRVASSSKPYLSHISGDKYLINQAENYYIINSAGDSLSAGVLDTTIGQYGPNLLEAHNGYYYAGKYSNNNNAPAIMKLDTNFNILWQTFMPSTGSFGHGVSAIMMDSGYVYVSGSDASSKAFVAKLDSTGSIIWHKEFVQSTVCNLTHLMKLQDGNFLANGNLDDYPLAFKFNSKGDLLWSYSEPIFISFNFASACEKANGNTILVMRNTLIELNTMGVRVDSTSGLNDYYDIIRDNDTLYLFGAFYEEQFSSKQYAFAETRNLNLDSTNAWLKTFGSAPYANNMYTSALRLPTGGILAVGKHRDSINVMANTYNILATRFKGPAPTVVTTIRNTMEQYQTGIIYPNPANNQLSIKADKIESVVMTDLLGNKMTINAIGNTISTAHIPAGFYLIQIRTKTSSMQSKVIIRH